MLESKKVKEGWWLFYWNGHDVSELWMDFFAGLSMKDESRCEELFIKKYGKKLNKQYPAPNQLTRKVQ